MQQIVGGAGAVEGVEYLDARDRLQTRVAQGVFVQLENDALGGVDLASSAGKMTMSVINAVAQFERDLLIERTQSGLKRAKSEGKTLGRPARLNEKQKLDVLSDLAGGMSVSALARKFDTSRQTIMRVRIEGDRSV